MLLQCIFLNHLHSSYEPYLWHLSANPHREQATPCRVCVWKGVFFVLCLCGKCCHVVHDEHRGADIVFWDAGPGDLMVGGM